MFEHHAQAHQKMVEAGGPFLGNPVNPMAVHVPVWRSAGYVIEHLNDGFAESTDLFPPTVFATALLDLRANEVEKPVDQCPHGYTPITCYAGNFRSIG